MFYGEQDYSLDDKGRMLIPRNTGRSWAIRSY